MNFMTRLPVSPARAGLTRRACQNYSSTARPGVKSGRKTMKIRGTLGGGWRSRMRDTAVKCLTLLIGRREMTWAEIADELEVSERTARRWVEAFSLTMDVRVEGGRVIWGEGKGGGKGG